MPIPRRYTTEAIVLSRFDFGEADRILTLITPGSGKLKAIAKGIRRPTSRLGGSLEPFAELQVALARGRTFEVVTQVSVGHAWLNLRDSLESAATAWYLAELADRSLEERHSAAPVYSLLKHAYGLLDAGMAPSRVARWFEMHLADELDIEAIAALRLAVAAEREVETAMRDFIRHALERDARSLAFLDEVRAGA